MLLTAERVCQEMLRLEIKCVTTRFLKGLWPGYDRYPSLPHAGKLRAGMRLHSKSDWLPFRRNT